VDEVAAACAAVAACVEVEDVEAARIDVEELVAASTAAACDDVDEVVIL
jgi:hypothetical protein